MSTSSELQRVKRLRSRFSRDTREPSPVTVGIGDDAAVLRLAAAGAGSLVWTVDAQVDGTHFRTDWVSWEDIGWRSFMAAASDLAAMGAEPVAALSSLVLAPSVDDEALDALARGQAEAADAIGAPVVGGNLARGTETSITTTLIGRSDEPVLRSGARAGDGLWLAGSVGLAGAGLALALEKMQDARMQDADTEACLSAWRRPMARFADGRALVGVAHAAIDISDGLALDAWQLAEASDVRLVLDQAAVLEAGGESLAAVAHITGCDPLELALTGGEDYALLAASPRSLPGFVQIGSVETRDGAGRLFMKTARGTVPLEPRGFDHFA
jgi:thiamine-monophosphate kinase